MANLLLDLPVSFLNFTLILGGGQYSLSCKNSDCSDGAYKDAKFPRKTILSTGARVAIKIGEDEYGIYASYMNVAVGKVKLEQVQSQDVPSPQTTEYDPSALTVAGTLVLFFVFYSYGVMFYRPDEAEFKTYLNFLKQYDEAIITGKISKLSALIDERAVFEYVVKDKYGKTTRQYMNKASYLAKGQEIAAVYQVTPDREIPSYTINKNTGEVFIVSFTSYTLMSGKKQSQLSYREHLHLSVEEGETRLTAMYSESTYNRYYPVNPR
ncbi:hypothetical protein CHS0354_026823 [Potamilus streckersoni]|uniref:Transmembrane protein n=1 Tax=Potamilus streckersoni TaxID=2493646 RepID=A0AAE0W872_9BIVA|nr:hypothetical protein CHS0354_026823 [Potamilus streckersoni]